ncbi:hydrogen peroxide-inducible genes activator [Paracraurococcus lichenis]|uniref:Hydrogen peroxide-inducible genes activator n=1 Tax=Paracraurococcus lichenis TaxID=3064888 RepID=A0ABT9E5A8_9PROT|nr:hydrogen peroxide-inducible genes activator [Paracraurococcus sp. LOR1-02]MDO9711349.1 hydrogen peroxide-inducible genes activator [Paracraurococcus sp. LOR1-02]
MISLPSPQQLRYLLSLADHGHFGRAASACAVTQSTLSAGIIALERQLDAALLERGISKRPVFTPLGLEVVERARQALAALEAVAETVASARDPLSGPLRLGVIPTIGPFLLPRLMPALREAFPRLRLWLREDQTERLVAQLESGRLDLLLLALPCACGEAETLPIAPDPFLAALPAGHRLVARDRVPVGALAAERLLLLEDGHCLRAHAMDACGLPQGTVPAEEGFAATSLHTLVQMVASGLGVTLVPRLAVDGGVMAGTSVAVRPLERADSTEAPPGRTLALAWRARSPRAAEFRDLAPAIAAAVRGE